MSNSYSAVDYALNGSAGVILGASETDTVVSKPFPISVLGSLHFIIFFTSASTTVATGITAKLQSSQDGTNWTAAAATVAITGNGRFRIDLSIEVAGDQADLPLLPIGRAVVSTGAGDAVTITKVAVVQGY